MTHDPNYWNELLSRVILDLLCFIPVYTSYSILPYKYIAGNNIDDNTTTRVVTFSVLCIQHMYIRKIEINR